MVPYPLPEPDGSPGVTNKPVKVYILSGQSNMVGRGTVNGTGLGTLQTMTGVENKFPNMVNDVTGEWNVLQDVQYRGVITDIGKGLMSPVVAGGTYGPELGFGYVMGYHHDEPVLVLKTSQGNRALGWDCLPPGSDRVVLDGTIYAAYGESPEVWQVDGPRNRVGWYAGKQYDDFFLDEGDMGPVPWEAGIAYPRWAQVNHNGVTYINRVEAHTSDATNAPGLGTLWSEYSVFNVTDVLDNFATEYPEYAAQGFEIAGFVWWQGHRDQNRPGHYQNYEVNLVRFIKSLRTYYENRYPGKVIPNAPFVVGTVGFEGWNMSGSILEVANAQLAVSGETGNHPEFAGNVKTVETRGYWRDVSVSPRSDGAHYHRNAQTYLLTGDALGRAMIELQSGVVDGTVFSSVVLGVSGTSLQMQFTGSAGTLFRTYKSYDLIDWVTGDDFEGTGEAQIFQYPLENQQEGVFYRYGLAPAGE